MKRDTISAICLTMKTRTNFLERAVDCFRRQTYPDKELIIVADPDCDQAQIEALAPEAKVIQCEYKLVVGIKRNIACESASGVYCAIWDDDDYSSPRRLEIQEELLRTSEKSVTAFRQLPFTDGSKWWMCPPVSLGIDTSLFFRRAWWASHRFLHMQIGQDAEMSRVAIAADQYLLAKECGVMFAQNHPDNTCPRTIVLPGWMPLAEYRWSDPQ